MSYNGYSVITTGTPQEWRDDGYVVRQATDTADGYTVKVCGLTQVDSVIESGTGVLTLNFAQLINVIAVTVTGVDPAVSNLTCTVANVNATGTNSGGHTSTAVVLQVWQAGSKGALTVSQGLCISVTYSKSTLVVGSATQAGMVAVL